MTRATIPILIAILLGCSGIATDEPEPVPPAPTTPPPAEAVAPSEGFDEGVVTDEEAGSGSGSEEVASGDEAAPGGEAEVPAPSGDSSTGTTCADKIDGVTRHSSTRYTLSQGFMDQYVRNQGRAQKQGSATWRRNKKKSVVGARIKSLNCAPQVAGLQNNDIIKEVNGRAITSTAAALAAYSDVSSASRFTVKLRRDKASMTISYTVE